MPSTIEEQQAALPEQELAANELVAEQEMYAAEQEMADLARQGASFGGPSWFKYGILFLLAISQDLVDLLDLSGVGAIIATAYSFVAGFLIVAISWLTNTKQNLAQNYLAGLEQRLTLIQGRISRALSLTARVSRFAKKSQTMRPVVRKGLRMLNKTKRFVKRSPFGKILIGNLLDLIPFLGILPWSTISIFLAYRDEKRTLQEAREASREIFPQ